MKQLLKRYSRLYTGEFASFILFIFVAFLFDYANPSYLLFQRASFWGSFILLEFILLQGTIYWHHKKQRLMDRKLRSSKRLLKKFKLFRIANIILIVLIPFLFYADKNRLNEGLSSKGFTLSILIYIFAILEFINYFYVQLSYDNSSDLTYIRTNKKLKKSILSQELRFLKNMYK